MTVWVQGLASRAPRIGAFPQVAGRRERQASHKPANMIEHLNSDPIGQIIIQTIVAFYY